MLGSMRRHESAEQLLSRRGHLISKARAIRCFVAVEAVRRLRSVTIYETLRNAEEL